VGDIPRKEAEFVERNGNLIAAPKANITEWDLPEAQVMDIETLHGRFKTLYEKCRTPAHTALDTQAKNEVEAAFIEKERAFIRFHLQNNEKMTDNGREALGTLIYDAKPTRRPPPDSHPAVIMESKTPFGFTAHIHDSKGGKWAKPDYTNGAVLFWSMGETSSTNPDELKTGVLITRMPHSMSFSHEERGKIAYMTGAAAEHGERERSME
jgi:hypothetical protein